MDLYDYYEEDFNQSFILVCEDPDVYFLTKIVGIYINKDDNSNVGLVIEDEKYFETDDEFIAYYKEKGIDTEDIFVKAGRK